MVSGAVRRDVPRRGMRLGWGRDSRGASYFAWGCFRDFVSRPLRFTAEATPRRARERDHYPAVANR